MRAIVFFLLSILRVSRDLIEVVSEKYLLMLMFAIFPVTIINLLKVFNDLVYSDIFWIINALLFLFIVGLTSDELPHSGRQEQNIILNLSRFIYVNIVYSVLFILIYIYIKIVVIYPIVFTKEFLAHGGGTWVSNIFQVFIISCIISAIFVHQTYCVDSSESLKRWKTVWNVVELIWIIGGGLSLFGIITSGYNRIRPEIVEAKYDELEKIIKPIVSRASFVDNIVCKSGKVDASFCDDLKKIVLLDSRERLMSITSAEIRALSTRIERFESADIMHKYLSEAGKYDANTFDIMYLKTRSSVNYIAFELKYIIYDMIISLREEISYADILPSWVRWVTILSPHVFASIFPLRLGRSLAAFRL